MNTVQINFKKLNCKPNIQCWTENCKQKSLFNCSIVCSKCASIANTQYNLTLVAVVVTSIVKYLLTIVCSICSTKHQRHTQQVMHASQENSIIVSNSTQLNDFPDLYHHTMSFTQCAHWICPMLHVKWKEYDVIITISFSSEAGCVVNVGLLLIHRTIQGQLQLFSK